MKDPFDEREKAEGPVWVTRPYLPPLEEFQEYLRDIWDSRWLTNNGKYHQAFERALGEYLGVRHISLFANGTLALVTALQALEVRGEALTSPFSFVATTHALWWNGIKPVFVDIEPETFTLDPDLIEAAVTPRTTAIVPVHVYGNPCRVERIRDIASALGLKVVYDACHTFGVMVHGVPLLEYGDLSVMSFHATKAFTTFEGGAIVCRDMAMKRRVDDLKNFGFAGETTVVAPGINAKMNEFQAALGLLQLKHIDRAVDLRKRVVERYREGLKGLDGVSCLDDISGVKHCYSYFPVLIDGKVYGRSRDEVYEDLKRHGIFGRRYFYPLISQFPTYSGLESARPGRMPIAERVASQVICLPNYPELRLETVDLVCRLLKG